MKRCDLMIVTREFPPIVEGGLGVRLARMVNLIRRLGIRICILLLGYSNFVQYSDEILVISIESLSYIHYTSKGIPLFSNDLKVLYDIYRLNKQAIHLLNKIRPKYVQIEEPVFGAFLSDLQHTRKIVSFHHSRLGEAIHSLGKSSLVEPSTFKLLTFFTTIGPLMDKLGVRNASKFIVPSYSIVSDLYKLISAKKADIHVVQNFVLGKFSQEHFNKLLKIKTREYVSKKMILFIGRLVPRKDIRTLLLAAKHVSGRIVIVGGGPQFHQLRKVAKQLNLNNVIFTGKVSDNVLEELRLKSIISVNPSRYEGGQPLAILDSMYKLSIPVLSYIGPHYEIVRNTPFQKYLFDPGDYETLSNNINELLNLPSSTLIDLFEESYNIIRNNFSPKKVMEKLKKVYNL